MVASDPEEEVAMVGEGRGGEKEGREKIKHKDVEQFMKYEKKKGRGRTYRDKRNMKRGVYN